VRFRYFDPLEQSTVEGDLRSTGEVAELISMVGGLRVARAPAIELVGTDGSSLVVGVAGERAVLLFTDADGAAAHSVSAAPAHDGVAAGSDSGVVFDFFGSYTELPSAYAVPVRVAVEAADGFASGARPPAASGLTLVTD
jgi:hypothetical protein